MYYPYFRGKQFDLIALRELSENGLLSQKIHPIIEPVKDSSALKKTVLQFEKAQQSFTLIENPQAGEFLTEDGYLKLHAMTTQRGQILTQPLEPSAEQSGLLILQQAKPALESDWSQNENPILLPLEFRLLQKVQGELILSEDVFTRLPRNRFYQELPDELFTNRHLNYQRSGFQGFSDFSLDSRIYYEKSFPSAEICIHLVYFKGDELRIHHFLSPEELPTQKDKFLAVMEEIANWQPLQKTHGLNLLMTAAANGKFPGMGIIRKASVMHHLELMGDFLDRR